MGNLLSAPGRPDPCSLAYVSMGDAPPMSRGGSLPEFSLHMCASLLNFRATEKNAPAFATCSPPLRLPLSLLVGGLDARNASPQPAIFCVVLLGFDCLPPPIRQIACVFIETSTAWWLSLRRHAIQWLWLGSCLAISERISQKSSPASGFLSGLSGAAC